MATKKVSPRATTATTVKMSQYEMLLSKSPDTKNKELVSEKVEEARIQIQRDVLEAKKCVTAATRNLEKAKASMNFNSTAILAAKYELENAQADFANLIELQEELF
jgi:hypothetical protein